MIFFTPPSAHTLQDYLEKKWLRVQQHPTLNLQIWNYSRTTEQQKHWDDVTRQCRCYVTDLEGKPIARTFSKFFNLRQDNHKPLTEETGFILADEAHDWVKERLIGIPSNNPADIPDKGFVVQEKMDGSLGVLFYYHAAEQWVFASRGSFDSPQAERGRLMLQEKYSGYTDILDKSISYAFEIVYETNRIVVDYGDMEELVYLSSFCPEDGKELFLDERVLGLVRQCGFPIVKTYNNTVDDYTKLRDLYKEDKNREGFVVRFHPSGERVKVKLDHYFVLHRIKSNLTIMYVWEWFRDNDQAQLALVPPEFSVWVQTKWDMFLRQYNELLVEANAAYDTVYQETCHVFDDQDVTAHSPKWVAEFAKINQSKNLFKSFIFAKRQGKAYRHIICELIKPRQDNLGSVKPTNEQPLPIAVCQSVKNEEQEFVTTGPTLIILRGPSGCSKTTWANNYVQQRSDNRAVIVNRDGFRLMCYGNNSTVFYEDPRRLQREEAITTMIMDLVKSLFATSSSNSIVILDGTHLLNKYVKPFLDAFQSYITIQFKIFDHVSLETALLYDRSRTDGRSSGEVVVTKQFKQFTSSVHAMRVMARDVKERQSSMSISTSLIIPNPRLHENGEQKPRCFVVDLDGTLCEKGSRHPFDYSRVIHDTIRHAVAETVYALQNTRPTCDIIICSGRDDSCRNDTHTWLTTAGIVFEKIYMRKTGDNRPDYIVKEEMWRSIVSTHYIVAMLDDRDQVVNHARACGFDCFQVQRGGF